MDTVTAQSLSEMFQEPGTLRLSPTRVAEFFGLEFEDLAEHAGVHPDVVREAPHTQTVQKYLSDMLRLLSVATVLTGDRQRAAFLLVNEPLRTFDSKTAAQLVQEGRVENVVRYLDSLNAGATG